MVNILSLAFSTDPLHFPSSLCSQRRGVTLGRRLTSAHSCVLTCLVQFNKP